MKAKKEKEVCYILSGGCHTMRAYGCNTLKKAMEKYNLKRIDVLEWWKEYERPFYL